MYNLMIKYNKGLAYYTNGQEVPEDIEEANLDNLLNYSFKENSNERSSRKIKNENVRKQGALGSSIAVVSGKGGVGKSNFSTNFAIFYRN